MTYDSGLVIIQTIYIRTLELRLTADPGANPGSLQGAQRQWPREPQKYESHVVAHHVLVHGLSSGLRGTFASSHIGDTSLTMTRSA